MKIDKLKVIGIILASFLGGIFLAIDLKYFPDLWKISQLLFREGCLAIIIWSFLRQEGVEK